MIVINGVAAVMAVCFLCLAGRNVRDSYRCRKLQEAENAKAALHLPYSDIAEARYHANKRAFLVKALGCFGNALVWALVFWVVL